MERLKEGQRVRIKSLDIKGTIIYIDHPAYFQHHFAPIQVELDQPYDDSHHYMYRTSVKDIVKLKKKKKVKKDDVLFDFTPKKKKKRKKTNEIIFDFSE